MDLYVLMHKSFAPRYRIPQFIQFFEERGIRTDLARLPRWVVPRLGSLARARNYDIVLLERKLIQPWELDFLRKRSRRLVFDFDDAVMYRSSRWVQSESSGRMTKFKRIVESCDLILAGNSFLKEEAMKFTSEDRISLIPTVVDLDHYSTKAQGKPTEELTIGWIGSAGTIHYLRKIMPVLEEVAKRFPRICLKIVCDRFIESPFIRVVKKPWEETEEVNDLKSFDIGVMPLTDDLWARGKCALKIVQYLAVGIPAVCSPVGTNRDIVRDGINGFWAETEEQWIDRLCLLIENDELRQKMGRAGREIVEAEYSLAAVGERLVRLLRAL